MLWYIGFVAVLNTGLGFAVAVHLARRHRELLDADDPGYHGEDQGFTDGHWGEAATATDIVEETVETVVPAEPSPPDEESATTEPDDPPSLETPVEPAAETPEDAIPEEPSPAEIETPEVIENVPAEPEPASEPPSTAFADSSSDPEDDGMEDALQQWRDDVKRYYDDLARLGNTLRDCRQEPETDKIRQCLDDLRTTNNQALEVGRRAHESPETWAAEHEDLADAQDDLRAATRKQIEMIEDTNEAIDRFDDQSGLEESCERMARKTTELMDVDRWVRSALEVVAIRTKQVRQGHDAEGDGENTATSTGLSLPEDVKSELDRWWEEDPQRTRHLAMAMIEVDDLAKTDGEFGREAGNRALKAIARLLAGGRGTVRMTGDRFALVFHDGDFPSVLDGTERMRQSIELAKFIYRSQEIRLTVSCGIVEATAEDTTDTLMARAESTLEQAKRYGGNRSFSHDGTFPIPVPVPELSLGEVEIPL